MQQLRARHPGLQEYSENIYDVLATLDLRWYCYCELAEGVGIAEAKSDRLRRYIWKTLNIVEDVVQKADAVTGRKRDRRPVPKGFG